MSRDYAKKTGSRKKSQKTNLTIWIVLVLTFTMFICALFFIKKHRYNKHTLEQKINKVKQSVTKKIATAKFDFYDISSKNKAAKQKARYELEIDTVSNFATADRLKAELTLLGFSVNVAPTLQQGRKKYYVSVGPYSKKDAATIDQKKLKKNKIGSSLKKLK